jgi:hypothetical protein
MKPFHMSGVVQGNYHSIGLYQIQFRSSDLSIEKKPRHHIQYHFVYTP